MEKRINPHTMYILRGVPGSGKSTLKSIIMGKGQEEDFKWFEADSYMIDNNGNYKFDRNKLSEAHKKCFIGALRAACTGCYDIIISNCSIEPWEYYKYLRLANVFKMNVQIISIDSTFNSIHTDDPKVIDNMLYKWLTASSPREALNTVDVLTPELLTLDDRWDYLKLICKQEGFDLEDNTPYNLVSTYKEEFKNTYNQLLQEEDKEHVATQYSVITGNDINTTT